MPGITDPSQEYFKNGLWAWVTDQWKKLVADASQFLQINIAAQGIDVEVKQTTAADLTPGAMGWDGSAWRKLPLMWGYSESWSERVVGTASGAGHATAVTAAIPAGCVYVLQAISAYHNAGANKWTQIYLSHGAATPMLAENTALPSSTTILWAGEAVLWPDSTLVGLCVTPGDGKAVYLHAWGYKMKVAE